MDTSSKRDTNARNELTSRLNSESAFLLGYRAKEGQVFMTTPRELTLLDNKVLRTERQASELLGSLPGIAGDAILRGLVLDEVVSSNSIESVHSTRREIKDALESGNRDTIGHKRFRELATLYMDLIDESYALPISPADIRSIYDKVMDGELDKRDLPDGDLFRAGDVNITDGVHALHSGLEPETEIVKAMEAMISLASSDEIPPLYSALASHYLFEYAHPFYDGNGRTGRYLLALYLSASLSKPTSLSLSRTIAENKQAYYRAFKSAQNPLNRGELTHFVFDMLSLVSDAQNSVIKRLELAHKLFGQLQDRMNDFVLDAGMKEKEAEITFMLMQYEAFGFYGDAPISEIAEYLNLGEQMTRKYLSALESKGVVCIFHKRRPLSFALADEFKERYGIRRLE